MLVQPRKAIGTRALLDPEIPGAKLLPDGKWAINRAAALLNFPALGLKVQVPVWSNKKIGDKVELLLNNVPVDQQTVTQPAEQTQRTTLFVAPGRFQTGAWELAYRVTRVAQQPEPFAPPLQLAVKLEIPAGQDTNPEQGHSNLHMAFRPPEIVQDGVDKDTAEKGVDIVVNAVPGSGSNLPYPEIAVGDVIIASWGGKLVASAPVTQAQIDDPLNNPIVIHISKDIILAAGDSGNEGLAVSFLVRDFVDNDSEDWCKEARIVVDTGNSRLDAPILKQADGNELDLDQLGNEQLLLQVVAASPVDFKLGDIIIMHLQGTTLDGDPVAVDARERIDKNPPLVVEVPMDNGGARALAKTQGVFFFDLERGGRIIQRSRGRFINMKGEPKRLAAPIVESAVSGALDPDLANVIVRIPYDPLITPDNAIELLWSITLADGTVFEPELDWIFPTLQEADDPDGFIVIISGPDYLKPGEGGTLKVSYNLLSEGENDEVIRRPSLPAAPLNIGEPRLELVPPILLGEQDGALEPKDLPSGISEVNCPNPVNNPTLPKDVVHWQLHDASNKLLFEDDKTLNALSAGKPVKFPLNAAFVQQYFEARRGEKLSVRYHIVRDATDKISYSNPLVFVVGEVVELVPPTIDSVKGLPGEVEIPDGGTTVDTMVKLKGKGAKGEKVQIKDGATVKGTADVDAQSGDWELIVTGLSEGDHRFTAIARYGSEQVSNPWVVVVTENVPLTIRSMKDQSNWDIPDNGYTVHTRITLEGFAPVRQKVEVFLGTISKGIAEAGSDRIWTHIVSGLTLNVLHTLKAVGQYANNPTSNLWRLTVLNGVAPTITAAHDSNGQPIGNGGNTVDRTVHLTGTANTFLEVEIYDGAISTGKKIRANDKGEWTVELTGLSIARHDYKAKALYGTGTESGVWAVNVVSDLVLDPGDLILNGLNLAFPQSGIAVWRRVSPAPGNASALRRAQGGTPPYIYRSSAPQFAQVDQTGAVWSEGNGQATVTVTDSSTPPQSRSYVVRCSNVKRLLVSPSRFPHSYIEAAAWIQQVGGIPISNSTLDSYKNILETLRPVPPYLNYGTAVDGHRFNNGRQNINNKGKPESLNSYPHGWFIYEWNFEYPSGGVHCLCIVS